MRSYPKVICILTLSLDHHVKYLYMKEILKRTGNSEFCMMVPRRPSKGEIGKEIPYINRDAFDSNNLRFSKYKESCLQCIEKKTQFLL